MKYDSAAITTQPFTKVALIRQKIYTSVILCSPVMGVWGMGGGGLYKWDSNLRSCRLIGEVRDVIFRAPMICLQFVQVVQTYHG
jgi:hypothetical protein